MHKLLIPILLLALTISLSSCKTTSKEYLASIQDWAEAMNALAPPLPAAPEMEPVQFEDHHDGGLWLSYNDYRALERNIIALKEYSKRLEVIIWFYRGEK